MAESLFSKLRKNTVIDKDVLKNSRYFCKSDYVPFDIPILNLALTGSFDGGLPGGILMIAAPPKHFKSSLMIQAMKAFQKKYAKEDNLNILYDSEFGTPDEYFESAGIDVSEERFDRRPVRKVEEFRSDIANLLDDISFGDKVLISLDSLGMLASNKEVEDAKEEKSAADMTRAKQIKSAFRIINADLNMKNIPMIVINHTYQTMEMYPEEVASGGRAAQYAGHTLWNIGKRQKKEGAELTGFDFIIKAKFSRYIREKSEFPIEVSYEDGIKKYSGIFDLAFDLGFIKSEKQGWYILPGQEKSLRRKEIEESSSMMDAILNNIDFRKACEQKYKL